MDKQHLDTVLGCLGPLSTPEGLIPFRYAQDDYARWLLAWALEQPASLRELKRTPAARLLDKPGPRACIAHRGDGRLDAYDLLAGCGGVEPYWLSMSRYGDPDEDANEQQMLRKGYNLVLQVNFPRSHGQAYRRLMDPSGVRPLLNEDHPVRRAEPDTMSWVRIDLDLYRREALIEEIQSDWLRESFDLIELADRAQRGCRYRFDYCGLNLGVRATREYYRTHISPRRAIWSELTLTAALWLLWEKLAISRVWYFTYEGSWLKGESCEPPRSLYSKLPKRFAFARTREAPAFLLDAGGELAKRLGPEAERPVSWFRLDLGPNMLSA